APARRVDVRAKTALFELRFQAVGVPWLDAERDVIDADARSSAALAEVRIERVPAADDDVADLADEALVLAALIVGAFPAEQVAVDVGSLLVCLRTEPEV